MLYSELTDFKSFNNDVPMKRIMVLAMDAAILKSLKDMLAGQFDVLIVNNAGEVFDQIDRYEPDLLLIDFILHDTNSAAITHQLKCDSKTQDMPIIIMSDYPELFKQSAKFGCNGFIQKPVSQFLLTEKIRCCLNTKKESTLERTGTYN